MKASESKFSTCLYFTTNALARKVDKLASETWKRVDLAPSHAYLLVLALEHPGMQAGCVADHLQLSPSTVTRLIEKLEEKKLVIRSSEGKVTNIFPTPKAKGLKPVLEQCITEFNDKYAKILGKEDSKRFITNMNLVADKL